MQTFTNQTKIPLSMAVYLATDHYDHIPGTISATKLMRPVRQLVLSERVPQQLNFTDILSLVKSRVGTSIHDGVEKSWKEGHYKQAMLRLGYPASIVDRIVVNPEDSELKPDSIPVYMEQRMFRDFMGERISGKYDFLAEGRLEDIKTTGAYTWKLDSKVEDYQLQGSIYRWLDAALPIPRITQDHMAIQFVFNDWAGYKVKSEDGYPPRQVEQKLIPLMSVQDTEDYITNKITQLRLYKNSDETLVPQCTDKELWRKETVYKYYRKPDSYAAGKRSTANFNTSAEAFARFTKDGGTGLVIEKLGQVIACKFCPAFAVCTQKDGYLADGTLTLD